MGWDPWVMPVMGSSANCITLDSTAMTPTAISPPYALSDTLKQIFKILSVNCITKGDAPSAMHGARIAGEILRLQSFSFRKLRRELKKIKIHAAESPWEII